VIQLIHSFQRLRDIVTPPSGRIPIFKNQQQYIAFHNPISSKLPRKEYENRITLEPGYDSFDF